MGDVEVVMEVMERREREGEEGEAESAGRWWWVQEERKGWCRPGT
jgi:hypothetical protein